MLRIELVKSLIGNNPRNRATIQALGLRKMHQVVEHKDSPSVRGMIHHVQHMVKVVEVPDELAKPVKPAKKAEEPADAPVKATKKAAEPKAEAEKPVKKAAKKKSEESSSEPE